jgi:TonB family protein
MKTAVLFSAIVLVAPAFVQAQTQVDERVYKLYASADYEQALTTLGSSEEPSAQLYRALCLLGLARQDEAAKVLKTLVGAVPDFTVSAEDVPPRFMALLTETRRQIVPALLLRLFAEAREQYQAKALDGALPRFEKIVAISSQPDVKDIEAVADLRTLAEGFIDLAKAPRAVEVRDPAPKPAAAPAAGATAAPTRAVVLSTPAVALKQAMPAWPNDLSSFTASVNGAVRVQISKTGKVTNATMIRGVHPRYDRLVLAATQYWEYKPATMNGNPVDSESLVEIRVNPTRR